MRKKISIFSFFSGIGILDLAFEKLLNSFGGEIELLDERNEYGNRYKFLLVSNTSEEL